MGFLLAAKARYAAVIASAHVMGREMQAADLLLASRKVGSEYAKAEAIIAELCSRPWPNCHQALVIKSLESDFSGG